ncbi:MAG: uracil-xanthine permease family protein [Eubacteriales bacterium]
MGRITFKYGLDDAPPFMELVLLGLQWLAISVPTVIIVGKVLAGIHYDEPAGQVLYLQKLFFVTAATLLVQVLWGHRLPLVSGPAAVLLAGVAASRSSDMSAIYTSIMVGGAVLAASSAAGLFGRLTKFFTSRVVAVILLLIAFTLAPTIMNLVISPGLPVPVLFNLSFTLVLVFLMFVANRRLPGVWKSTLMIWSIIAGSAFYFLLFPQLAHTGAGGSKPAASFIQDLNLNLNFDPGVLVSFLICYLALSINDLGSIQSLGELLRPGYMENRIKRGITLTGLANVLSGLLGVIGPVNFSLSPGVIVSTGNASRFTLIPAGLGMLALSFLPGLIAFIGSVPSVVTGAVLIFIMCSQISAGLMVVFSTAGGFKFEHGLIVGLPLMLGVIISFLPVNVLGAFPAPLRPLLGNGFVVGVLAVLVLEHIIYREPAAKTETIKAGGE